MNYWIMQLHPDDRGSWDSKKMKKLLNDHKTIGCGDLPREKDKENTFRQLEIGDIVLVRHQNYHALVEVEGEFEHNEERNKFHWFHYIRKVKILDECSNPKHGIRKEFKKVYGKNWNKNDGGGVNPIGALSLANDNDYIKFWHEKIL